MTFRIRKKAMVLRRFFLVSSPSPQCLSGPQILMPSPAVTLNSSGPALRILSSLDARKWLTGKTRSFAWCMTCFLPKMRPVLLLSWINFQCKKVLARKAIYVPPTCLAMTISLLSLRTFSNTDYFIWDRTTILERKHQVIPLHRPHVLSLTQ